jgi:23S rRNA (adenine2503-C2)-methyltransferase
VESPLDIFGLTSEGAAEAASRTLPTGAGIAGRLYAAAFRTGVMDPEALGASPPSAAAWRAAFRASLLDPRRTAEEQGPFGPTRKASLALPDGREVECVCIPMPGGEGAPARGTLCVSSQAGCRMGCAFCETGREGLARSLTAAEIVAQAVTARTVLGWDFRNIVFMGMGEPLDNFTELARALAVLADRRGFALAAERMTVCTCGPAGGATRLAGLGLGRLNLSISLNAADDALRDRLMPVNRTHCLSALAAELRGIARRRNFVLGVNWCLLPGINDTREDARRAAVWCREAGRTLLNLIPYNPGSRPLTRAPLPEEIDRFAGWLREEGLAVRERAAKGATIMAACGQLRGG